MKYFNELVKNIEGCSTHIVKYGKTILFVKFLDYEFNYQAIKASIKIIDNCIMDITLESIFSDFVKIFDKLSSDKLNQSNNIQWNIYNKANNGNNFKTVNRDNNNDTGKKEKGAESNKSSNKDEMIFHKEIVVIFNLLDMFVESLLYLSTLSQSSEPYNSSLNEKTIEIRDVSIVRKTVNIEFLIDNKTILMSLSPKKKLPILIIIDNDKNTGDTMKQIMLQSNPFQNLNFKSIV